MVLQRPHEAGPSCIDGVEQQIGVVRDEARALDARVSSHYIIIAREPPPRPRARAVRLAPRARKR